jgi:hypothetical protein
MVRNLSREFAAMTDEERRRFALERGGNTDELDLHDPREPGPHASPGDELADPDARDDRAHDQHIETQEDRRDE